MSKPLRYTGCWPPVSVLREYPNWVCAFDEEDEPDQDETTIKPEVQQVYISLDTQFTAVEIEFAGGARAIGLLFLFGGETESIDYFDEDANEWVNLKLDCGVQAKVRSVLPRSNDQHLAFSIPIPAQRKPWHKVW